MIIFLGEFAYFINDNDEDNPHIGQITRIYKNLR
jgi:hypothetical protein